MSKLQQLRDAISNYNLSDVELTSLLEIINEKYDYRNETLKIIDECEDVLVLQPSCSTFEYAKNNNYHTPLNMGVMVNGKDTGSCVEVSLAEMIRIRDYLNHKIEYLQSEG